jgi:thiazole tautomerase (transcriptional regulator TenI)
VIPFAPPLICLVTRRKALAPDARTVREECLAIERQVDEAVSAGIDLIHVRERDMDARELVSLVSRLVARSRGFARIVVNDRADVAAAARADGVHLRADSPPASTVRGLGPGAPRPEEPELRGWLIGRSIHSTDEARQHADADYLVFGTVFASRSKPAGHRIGGLDGLADAAVVASIPVLAIGGITPARTTACRDAGAAGVSAIELFLPKGRMPDALGPADAAAAIRSAWHQPAGKLR